MTRTVLVRTLGCTLALIVASVLVRSQSLELKPGFITGTMVVGSETINQSYVYAYWQSQSSSSSQNSATYNLTVNVPSGTSPVYTVRPEVYMDGSVDYLQVPEATTPVAANQTSTLNFNVSPAYVNGTLSVQNGTLSIAYIYANSSTGGWSARTYTTPQRGLQFRFPVVPSTVRIYGDVYFTNGTHASIPLQTLGAVAAGGELSVSLNAAAPSTDGAVQGTLSVTGPRTTSLRRVIASGPVGRSATPSAGGSYQITQLPAGSYNAYAELYYNQNRTYYRSPYGHTATGNPTITISGNTVTRDFSIAQGFIQGTLALTGTKTLAHASYAEVYVSGSASSTQSGYGYDEVSRPSGDFELIVSPGTWSMNNYAYISFSTPSPYLNGQLGIYDYQNAANPILVAEGDIATRNLAYETGTITAVLRSSGVTFSAPRVYASCNDTVNGQPRTFWYASFNGNQSNVTVAPVTLVGIKGRCTISTYGRPTGSSGETLFGQVTADLVPGSDLTIDVGGPQLTVTSPTANTAFTAGPINVTGTATDDQQVTAISVNGTAATLTSTNNPNDPREVSFSASVALVNGANQIATIATDNDGKTASDTRNVYLDNQDPAVTWTPPDGTTYPTPQTITISGTATDNVGISTITVNGSLAYTNSGTPQTSVNFSRNLTFSGGTHQLTVVVKDLGNRTTTETRTITVDAPQSTTSIVTSPNPSVSGQSVTLSATVNGGSVGTPTGSVQFKDNGSTIGTVLLNGGTASLTTSSLAVGSHTIEAVYSGSFIFLSSSASTSHAVNKISTSTSLASSPNPSTYPQSVTFTATVSSVAPGTGTPTGTVQFKQGSTVLASGNLSGGAVSRALSLQAGTPTIEAVYLGTTTFDTSTANVSQTVNKATPVVNWATPAQIVYGTALNGIQLNASANVTGTHVYTPAAGTVLSAGTHTLSDTFTPSDSNYEQVTRTVNITVIKRTPTLSTSGGTFTYDGLPHGSTGTSNVAGTFSYSYSPGGSSAPVNASATPYQVTATFTPDDTVNNHGGTATNTITINKAVPTVTWTNPSAVAYGTALSATQLNATASVPGSFAYSPASGTQLNAGSHTLSVTFTPSDSNYEPQTRTVTLTVSKGTPTLSTSGGTFTYDGSPHGSTGTSSVPGSFSYSYSPGGTSAPVNASATPYQVAATFTPSDPTNYNGGTATNTITINKATPTITWSAPADIVYGAALGAAQLNATANAPGTFAYTPASGAVLDAGSRTLSVTFTPTDAANYESATRSTTITVTKATATLSLGNLSHIYDGSGKSASVTADPSTVTGITLTYNGGSSLPANAGSYTVVASLTNSNYSATPVSGTLTIAKAQATLTLGDLSQTYNGAAHAVSVASDPTGLSGISLTYDGSPTAPTAAGSYAVVASLDNANYEATPASGTLTIGKASATITLANLNQVYSGSSRTATATTNPTGLQSITLTYNGGTIAPTNAGSYAVLASLNNANYSAPNVQGTLVISKATATLALGALSHTYDGSPKAATATSNPGGLTVVSLTYNGSSTTPTGAGSYAVQASLVNQNYEAQAVNGTMTIAKAGQSITFGMLSDHIYGDAPFNVAASASSGLTVSFSATGACSIIGATVTISSGGQCTITANQPGDDNYNPALTVSRSFNTHYSWTDLLQPINADGSSVFKLGSTVPVRFRLTGASAAVTNLQASIYLAKVSNGVVGTEVEATATNSADGGNVFRYDATEGQYIFNLGTKPLSQGTWQVRVDLLDGASHVTLISLRK